MTRQILQLVIGYKNRDVVRVQRCLASLSNQNDKHFRLTLLDYGSDEHISSKVKKMVSSFDFCSYIFSNSRGQFWNRSHALNSGVKASESSEFIVTTDIDLIFPPNFISGLKVQLNSNFEVHIGANNLSRDFKKWSQLFTSNKKYGVKRANTALGLVQCIDRSVFEKIGGFNEYYCIWGAEDEELNERLSSFGMQTKWISLPNNQSIYHQWHPSSSNRSFNLPARWQEHFVNYKLTSSTEIVTNQNLDWGKLLTIAHRPTIDLFASRDQLTAFKIEQIPIQLLSEIIDQKVKELAKGESVYFKFQDHHESTIKNSLLIKLISKANYFLNWLNAPFMLTNDMSYFNRYQNVIDYRDLISYYILKHRNSFSDYYLSYDKFELDLILVK